ncbi:ROK family glucokinase [Pradoshia sp. D12]|uniref:ROK family glucokinase n=1 Tax=Bacillaceae TaxID=186817 RepID=UPI00080AE32E|nr:MULTISPECIES: ROK family glucokinase [Bacillaceae]OCA86389.1 glucokinase [Bacillus sp. FJAT-27986]QFK72188.1 ROK family glucokinase [Pradoshia sp. D12]TPF71319.1 ROK family glucokinase [Bacillus sp. D12]
MLGKQDWLLGIDIGGTTIKLAFIDKEGTIVHKWEIITRTEENGLHIVSDIGKSVRAKLEEWQDGNLVGVGMGAPGPVNFENGSIYVAVNIGWRDFPLKELLEKELGIPAVVDNDANVASFGEFWKGAGKGTNDLVCITLGTGVGGGVITNKHLVHGISGAAGELGHITVQPEGGAPCNCGKTGCVETIASATGIVRLALEKIKEKPDSDLSIVFNENGLITSKDVVDCAIGGDQASQDVLDEVAKYLGLAAANVGNMINPDIIVIGGGVSKAGDIILKPIEKYFKQFAFPRVAESTEIKVASLGNDAGVIGAAGLIMQQLGQEI